MPRRWFERGLSKIDEENMDMESKEKGVKSIKKYLEDNSRRFCNTQIIYFPTYRRIEEDFNVLFNTDDNEFIRNDNDIERYHIEKHKELLQFGMKDVENTFSSVLESIRVKSIESFNELSEVLLSQYLNEKIKHDINFNENQLRISLDRIGDKISDEKRSA